MIFGATQEPLTTMSFLFSCHKAQGLLVLFLLHVPNSMSDLMMLVQAGEAGLCSTLPGLCRLPIVTA